MFLDSSCPSKADIEYLLILRRVRYQIMNVAPINWVELAAKHTEVIGTYDQAVAY